MSKQNWQAQIDATQDTRISHAEVGRILGEWYADYGGPSRIDEDVFLSLTGGQEYSSLLRHL